MGYSSHRSALSKGAGTEAFNIKVADLVPSGEEALAFIMPSVGLDSADLLCGSHEWHADDYVDALSRKLIEWVADGDELHNHSYRLALFGSLLGVEMGLDTADLWSLRRGAFLHDIGKIGIPSSILLKRGPLDEREWHIMKQHPLIGEEICRDIPSLGDILPIVRSHHQRWDGTGYPDGLRGEQIPLLARITQMADIYDALTTERPYKSAFTPEKAMETIKEEGQREWRDPRIVRILEDLFPVFRALPSDGALSFSMQALADVVRRRSWS